MAVSIRDAAVRLGDRTVWSGVSLDIPSGEFVAILGPNGAGKSTLLKAALGLLPLSAGELQVLGQVAGRARRHIGYLPQRHGFDPQLPVRGVDVVRLGVDGDRFGVPLPGADRWTNRGRLAAARVAELVVLVGADSYAERPIGALSGGEQQRLMIAQALARHPRLLMLDEPLDSLDLPNQAAIAALVSRICRTEQVTVLIVAHDVNPLLPYLDRVVYLAAGTAVSGTPEQVVTAATLSRLYSTPIEVLRTADGRLVVVGEPEASTSHGDRHRQQPAS